MTRELGIIADLQCAEVAMSTKYITLGFDATTQEGDYVNSIHLTTKTGCQVVAVDQLAGGTADYYKDHVCEPVDHLARVYADL